MTARAAHLRFALLSVLLLFQFCGIAVAQSTAATSAEPLGNAVDISADHLEVQHQKRFAVFEGKVRAAVGKLHLTCAKLSLQYDDKGEVVKLTARGAVDVHTDGAEATAGSARLDAKRGILILEDRPTLTRGPHRLTGSRIEVELRSGRVDVADASGTFELKTDTGVAP